MSIGLIGTKIGMTREFMESGQSVPVTVIKVEKGRWGKFYLIKSKKKILLDKNLDVASIDLDQAKEIYKANTSKK